MSNILKNIMEWQHWSLVIIICLIISAIGQFATSKQDGNIKEDIKKDTDSLVNSAKETIKNLDTISKNAKIAQNAAMSAYGQLDDTYKITLLNLKKADKNNKAIIENLENTLKAKEDILKSQSEMISKLSGGDSYPYITFFNNKLQLNLHGDYGIPDLRIEIVFLKNYLKINHQACDKYINDGEYNDDIIKFYDQTFKKLYVNKRYQGITIPNEILESIVNDLYAGFDIKFNSGYKSWTQCIRLHKYGVNINKIEQFNILYESKEKKAIYPEDLVKILKLEASPNYKDFSNDFKKSSGLDKYLDYLVILYPFIDKKEFKEKEVDQSLSPLYNNQFRLRD